MTEMRDAFGLLVSEPSEDRLLREIAYCKAQLIDIGKAPDGSRHKQGLSRARRHLEECQHLLAQVRRKRSGFRH